VVVRVPHRTPPRSPEGAGVDVGSQKPAFDLRQVAIFENPVDVLVTHRAKLQAFGANHAAPHTQDPGEADRAAVDG
jgi:hypothetical protein